MVFVFTFNFPILFFNFNVPKNIFHLVQSFTGNNEFKGDPRFKLILWSIITGTRGGINRAKILNLVMETPLNANKMASTLKLDYKTITHHVKILIKNQLLIKTDESYGAIYALSPIMEDNQETLKEMMEKIGTK